MTFEQLDRSIDADSDSEDEAAEQAHAYRCTHESNMGRLHYILTAAVAQEKGKATSGATQALSGLHIRDSSSTQPPKPPALPAPPSDDEDEYSVEEDDENNPFGDRNALQTPYIEKGAPKW